MLTILPNEGVSAIRFGISRAVVRDILSDSHPRLKETDSPVPADYFVERGVIVHYDAGEIVEAVEMAQPSDPTFFSQALIGQPFDRMVDWFRSIDPGLAVDDSGLTSFRFGVGLYAPHAAKSPRDPVEGVIVFRPGYYG
jgi:hypothetical protein